MSTFYIVFPRDNRSKITIVEIQAGLEYEISDYSRASRKSFDDPLHAHEYATTLAAKHNVEYRPDFSLLGQEAIYLD